MTATGIVTRFVVHPGVYKDSLVLMQLQQRLLERPGVVEAGAAMASAPNLELLAAGGLLPEPLPVLHGEDLLIVIRAESETAADGALASISGLLESRHATEAESYRPRSLDGALSLAPDARWVLISVPGEHAPQVAREALDRGLNVFLYSDNVPSEDAVALKSLALRRGLMVLGPDCGTAIIAGTGLGFANRVRRGPIGLVGGSGTGLQAISVRIHQLGSGVSQVIGTGGQDLSNEIGGLTTRQALRVLGEDPETEVIALVSKSPSEAVANIALDWANESGKPVVVYFQGFRPPTNESSVDAQVHLASSLTEAAAMVVALLGEESGDPNAGECEAGAVTPATGLVRGLFAGGTLAAETLYALAECIAPLYSNLDGKGWRPLDDIFVSQGNCVLDLGSDELTHGRLHPMIDQTERLKRLASEAADEEVGLILLDVVLGEGAHPDPAAELAPAIRDALTTAAAGDRDLRIVVLLIGTEGDPQDFDSQSERLEAAGAVVVTSVQAAVQHVEGQRTEEDPTVPMLPRSRPAADPAADSPQAVAPESAASLSDLTVDASAFAPPLVAINIGLDSFHASLVDQGTGAIQVDWRPPAGGNEKLTGILDRLKATQASLSEVND